MALKKGLGEDFIINLICTLLFYVPGIMHALLVCGLVPANCCGAPAKTVIEIVLLIICPPTAVLVQKKVSVEFVIALVLTFLFYVPALIYAAWVLGYLKCGGRGGSVAPSR